MKRIERSTGENNIADAIGKAETLSASGQQVKDAEAEINEGRCSSDFFQARLGRAERR